MPGLRWIAVDLADGGYEAERVPSPPRLVAMPTYRIHIINSDFKAEEHRECSDLEAAKKHALKGALEIGSEQALNGHQLFGAEVRIDQDEQTVARFMVAVGSSPLQ